MNSIRARLIRTAAALTLGLAAPLPAVAGGPVLVELFTSQGCSSCPPADSILGELAERQDVLPLALHVDYWDYLGWRDTFADQMFTKRQIEYRDAWRERVVYTPQMVVSGNLPVQGNRRSQVEEAIDAAAAAAHPGKIDIIGKNGGLTAELTDLDADAVLYVAVFDETETVDIQRGENGGREITYHHIVRDLMRVGTVGGAGRSLMLPQPDEGQGVAIWAQKPGMGAVLATAAYRNSAALSLAGQ